MKYLDAVKILREATFASVRECLVATSGNSDPLLPYMKAQAALRSVDLRPRTLAFNTLRQHLLTMDASGSDPETVYLLTPWDVAPAADWRSGVPSPIPDPQSVAADASQVLSALAARKARILYLPAPIPPISHSPTTHRRVAAGWSEAIESLGARVLPSNWFSLATYLGSGCPVGGEHLGEAAGALVESLLSAPTRGKVLVTDLDNVLWAGVIAEDGLEGIACGPEGRGYPHFIYQTFLRHLRQQGVLLAAVSRNDPATVADALKSERNLLGPQDFVAVLASYGAKSSQLRLLAERLNLGLDSFVFVDDNPVELAEVCHAIPEVRVLGFPSLVRDLPSLIDALQSLFGRDVITEEDKARTELYRMRLEGLAPSQVVGADLHAFLKSLGLTLLITDRTSGDRARAVQLINKTNQFNLNGRRYSDQEVAEILASGGRLFAARLRDRTGDHGEIAACLVTAEKVVVSLVLSCRVLQRRAEHALVAWIDRSLGGGIRFDYAATARNGPIQEFMSDPAFTLGSGVEGQLVLDGESFRRRHAGDLALVTITEESDGPSDGAE